MKRAERNAVYNKLCDDLSLVFKNKKMKWRAKICLVNGNYSMSKYYRTLLELDL